MKFFIQCCLILSTVYFYLPQTNAQPTITIDAIVHATCNASTNGAIMISVTGTPPFGYTWNTGATTQDITGLFSGFYRVTVTSGAGTTVSGIITVNSPPVLSVNTDTVIAQRCAGTATGEAYVNVTGGTPGYTYLWDNGQTTQDATGLNAGPANLTVTDANGCTASSKSIFIDSASAINLVVNTIQPITCHNLNNGYINTTATGGGTGSFTYLWSSGQTTGDISGLAAGAYTLTATSSNGCTVTSGPHLITNPALLSINLDSIRNVRCNAANNGGVFLSVSGGTPNYSYSWSNGRTTQDITGLGPGSFRVTVTDANGCTATSGFHTVTEPPVLAVSVASITQQSCANTPTGAVDIQVIGGTPAYTYLWNNGATTQDINNLYSGVNDVTVTDANGCTASAKSIFIDSISAITVTLNSIVNVSCNGSNNGAVFISVAGGDGGTYFYNWSNGRTTQDITGLAGGVYTVTVADSSGCVRISGPHIVNEPTALNITLDNITPVVCNGALNGSVSISVAGGTPNYTYNWSNGRTTQDITGLAGGSYTLTLTDANGCTATSGAHIVNENTAITVTLNSITNVLCNGQLTGAVFVSDAGGVPTYTYNWSNGRTTQDITGLGAGSYTLTLTDAAGCTRISGPHVVSQPSAITVTLDNINNITCNGLTNGAVFISATGGTTNYSYNWSNGRTTQDITGLGTGSYTLTLTDANGCTATTGPHLITQPSAVTITLDNITPVVCNGALNGSVSISVAGGTPNYTYNWSNGRTTQDITGLAGGSYTLTLTDANGCTATSGAHIVNENTAITVTLNSITNVLCNGQLTGAVLVSDAGGVPTYTYNWSNGRTTQDITGLGAGSYTLTLTDAAGCTRISGPHIVSQPSAITVTLDNINNITCNGLTNGAVFVSVAGGTTNYSYNWSNGRTTQDITGLGTGSYTLTLTDANGCTATTGPHLITQPSAVTITLDNITPVVCNGALNGSVSISVAGGTPNYTYNWSNGRTTQDITGLAGGSYTLTLTDANGCTATSGAHIVNENTAITVTLNSITNILCNGQLTGAVFVSDAGGVPTYTYNWSNGRTTQDITGLGAGSYTLTLTDAAGCTRISGPHVVSQPSAITVTLDNINNITCNGLTNGAVFVSVTGGTTNYSYNWSNGRTTQDITGLGTGSYTLTLTDANGCTATTGPHLITQPSAVTITLDNITPVVCNGALNGSVSISVAGGTPNYTYNWSNGRTTQDITGLAGGSYTLTLTDANGCTATSGAHIVNENTAITVTLNSITNILCNGQLTGAVFVSDAGGVPTYTYNWSNGRTTQDITGLGAGSYTLTLTDAAGCTRISGPHVVSQPSAITVTLDNINNISCNGLTNGAVFVSVAGGTTNYSYNWSNGSTTQDITGLGTGSYTLTLTDANGCTATTGPHTITEPTVLAIALDSIDQVSCNGAGDGAVWITVSGGTLNYIYNWSNNTTTQDLTGLSGGSYTLTVTDANGCTASSGAHVVNENSALVLTLDSLNNITCNGFGNGAIFVSANGGVINYIYNWSNGQTTQDLTGLNAGSYTLTLTDADGCTVSSGPHLINEPTVLNLVLDSVSNVSCNGANDGAVLVSVSGGTLNYIYNWSNGATTQDITGLSGGIYNLTLTDANGCTATTGVQNIIEPSVLNITLDSINGVTCNGLGNGGVYVSVTGGTLNYNYNWSNGRTTEDNIGLSGGIYTLTVTDANGCSFVSGPHTVIEPAALQAVIDTFKNESCIGISDGFINSSALGGRMPYSFAWSNGATTDDISGLVAGPYTVTITDSSGCTAVNLLILNNIPTITISLNTLDSVSCNGLSDGAIQITTTLGAPNYTWLWSNAATTEDITGLSANTYSVTVTDSLGCQVNASFNVFQPDILTVTLDNITDVSCNGAADGAISITTTGGTLNYNFAWTNGRTTEDITGLSGSTNSVVVTDANGCSTIGGVYAIQEDSAIVISLDSIVDVDCNGAANGGVYISVTGGVLNYNYNWSNSSNIQDLTNLSGGSYTLTLTDAAGCTAISGAHLVDEPNALGLVITPTVPLEGCLGEPFGELVATATGGAGTLVYLWSNNVTTFTNSGLNTGNYTVKVTDANGCTITDAGAILDPFRPTVSPYAGQSPIIDTTVNWNDIISIDAGNNQTVNGVNYVWTEIASIGNLNLDDATAPATSVNPQPDSSGAYILLLTATSADGCTDTGSIVIRVRINDLVGMPNAFTPGNGGPNDYFQPVGLDDQFILEYSIFNRWGQKIFSDTNTDYNWDGTYMGVEQPSDVYIYLLRYKLPGQTEKILRGEFTLIR